MTHHKGLAADRLLGLALIGLAAFIAVQAIQLEVPFSYEPVGPKAFPLGLSGLLAVLSLVLIFKPDADGTWPNQMLAVKLMLVLGLLLVYALLFTRLGYMPASLLAATILARLFHASWRQAIVAGSLLSVGSYFLFTAGLGIVLPTGYWLSAVV